MSDAMIELLVRQQRMRAASGANASVILEPQAGAGAELVARQFLSRDIRATKARAGEQQPAGGEGRAA